MFGVVKTSYQNTFSLFCICFLQKVSLKANNFVFVNACRSSRYFWWVKRDCEAISLCGFDSAQL